MGFKVTFAKIVTISKVYGTNDEDNASEIAYNETQAGRLDMTVTVPEGFTVESIEDEDTIWEVDQIHAPGRSILRP